MSDPAGNEENMTTQPIEGEQQANPDSPVGRAETEAEIARLAAEKGLTAPGQPEPGGEGPEQREQPGEPVQPAEADPEAASNVIQLRTPKGALTIRPGQVDLDSRQVAALVAIGIDTNKDPGVVHHIRPFMHMCQIRDLDPYAKEAYLIGRGNGDNRKYTMQVAIDGYRKMAGNTGRFIRVKKTLWTGQDDDDRTWVRFTDEDGDVVMQRVWFDQWPEARGYPGAAKVVIEHYDETGRITSTAAIADWKMYAPLVDKWHWGERKGEKVYDLDAQGNRIQELTEMWAKGYAHMLAKCAEALAHRRAFPNTMNGVYIHEEMHRADAEERTREQATAREVRRRAHAEATSSAGETVQGTATETTPAAQTGEPERGGEPVRVGETAQDIVEAIIVENDDADAHEAEAEASADRAPEPQPDAQPDARTPQDRARMLRAELEYQARILGHAPRALARRPMATARKDLDDFTDVDLLPMVTGLRTMVVDRLRATNQSRDAAIYAEIGPDQVVAIEAVFGED